MAKETFHVTPHDDGWAVKREGSDRASSTHNTQKEAIDSARNLARDGDDIVIHRADGTIRERVSPTSTGGNGNAQAANGSSSRAALQPQDVLSVGSRVSWPAILAGLAVTVTVYVGLTLLAIAVGLTTMDNVRARTFAIGATLIGIFNLLASLFLGGYVASRLTTRETQGEAVVYGVLVWAALFFTLLLTGVNMGGSLGMMAQAARTPQAEAAAGAQLSSPEAQQRREEMRARGEQMMAEMNPAAVAWWAFAGMALSVLASIGGAIAGAGPELYFRRAFRREPETQVVAPRPA
jgi:hypothetical protein